MSLFDQSQVTTETILQLASAVQTVGVDTPNVDRISSVSDVVESHGGTMLTNGQAGYSKGATFRLTSVGTGIPALYQNIGTNTSSNWALIETSAVQNSTVAYNLISTAGPATYTAAQMVDAIIDRNGGTSDRADVTDTAVNIVAAIPGAIVGSAFTLNLRNVSTTAGEKIGITGGTGVTISGTASTYANGSIEYIGIVTAIGTPAVTLYNTLDADALLPATDVASSVNAIATTTAATGAAPSFIAVGSDTNIGATLAGKGTGIVALGQATGGVNAFRGVNYIATETGANNAIAGALVDANGTAIPLVAGLEVTVKLAHTVQAGANTFNYNAGGALNVRSHFNVANNISTPYAITGVIKMVYDGTEWIDMSQ